MNYRLTDISKGFAFVEVQDGQKRRLIGNVFFDDLATKAWRIRTIDGTCWPLSYRTRHRAAFELVWRFLFLKDRKYFKGVPRPGAAKNPAMHSQQPSRQTRQPIDNRESAGKSNQSTRRAGVGIGGGR